PQTASARPLPPSPKSTSLEATRKGSSPMRPGAASVHPTRYARASPALRSMRSSRVARLADGLLPRPGPAERAVTVGAERDARAARLAIKDAPPLERLDARLLFAVTRRVARARDLRAAAGADAERMLLHEARELVGHAGVRRDARAATQRARRGELPRHGVANELALVRHRVEQRRQLGLDLERDDLLVRAWFAGHRRRLPRV